jgi:cyanate permease
LRSSVSNISGFAGPYLTGCIAEWTGSFTYALLAIAIIVAAGPAFLLTAGRRKKRLDGSLS